MMLTIAIALATVAVLANYVCMPRELTAARLQLAEIDAFRRRRNSL